MASGIDQQRLSLLLAVLEKRAGLNLAGDDVFVNIAGGMTVDEPASDLGVLAAIASSVRNRVIPADHGDVRGGRPGRRGPRDHPGAAARPRGGADGIPPLHHAGGEHRPGSPRIARPARRLRARRGRTVGEALDALLASAPRSDEALVIWLCLVRCEHVRRFPGSCRRGTSSLGVVRWLGLRSARRSSVRRGGRVRGRRASAPAPRESPRTSASVSLLAGLVVLFESGLRETASTRRHRRAHRVRHRPGDRAGDRGRAVLGQQRRSPRRVPAQLPADRRCPISGWCSAPSTANGSSRRGW